MTLVRSSSKDSRQRRMYVQQDIKNALPADQSPLNLEGAEGLRKFFLCPAEEVGIGEDWALPRVGGRIGSGTFRACAGLSLLRSRKSLWVASF